MFAFIHQWFTESPVDLDGLTEHEVAQAIEAAIDKTDSRLRAVAGYQRKLRPAVVEALLHARELIHAIPGPIEINRRAYAHHPLVNSLFGSVDQLGEVFSLSAEAQAQKKKSWTSGNDHLYGLLLMSLQQRTRPGFVLNGDMIQGDVLQKIAFFSNHVLVKVGSSEEEVRALLRERALETMLQEYKRRVAAHIRQDSDLRREQARLRRDSSPEAQEHLPEVERELRELSKQLLHLDDHLDLLIEVLTNPDDHCGLKHRELQLNRNGVVQEIDAGDLHRVPYAEITHGGTTRAGLLVRYPFEELSDANHLHVTPSMAL